MSPSERAAARPLLLLDVDGVLQPVGRSVPPGYRRFSDEESEAVLNGTHGTWLAQLSVRFDLVWATTWGERANRAIGLRLGLPHLPHLDLSVLTRDGTRKLPAVAEFVGDRPVAWIDDELYEDAFAWAAARRSPTILRRTAAGVGMTQADLEALEAFASELDTPAT